MRPTRLKQFLGCVLALSALGTAWSADIHKWVDENGEVHYSDQPPPTSVKNSSTLRNNPRPTVTAPQEGSKEGASPSKAPLSPAEQEMEFKKRRSEQAEAEAKAQKEDQETAERKRNCEVARGHLSRLQQGGLIVNTNAKGETAYMNDKEIADETDRARKQVEQLCKS